MDNEAESMLQRPQKQSVESRAWKVWQNCICF